MYKIKKLTNNKIFDLLLLRNVKLGIKLPLFFIIFLLLGDCLRYFILKDIFEKEILEKIDKKSEIIINTTISSLHNYSQLIDKNKIPLGAKLKQCAYGLNPDLFLQLSKYAKDIINKNNSPVKSFNKNNSNTFPTQILHNFISFWGSILKNSFILKQNNLLLKNNKKKSKNEAFYVMLPVYIKKELEHTLYNAEKKEIQEVLKYLKNLPFDINKLKFKSDLYELIFEILKNQKSYKNKIIFGINNNDFTFLKNKVIFRTAFDSDDAEIRKETFVPNYTYYMPPNKDMTNIGLFALNKQEGIFIEKKPTQPSLAEPPAKTFYKIINIDNLFFVFGFDASAWNYYFVLEKFYEKFFTLSFFFFIIAIFLSVLIVINLIAKPIKKVSDSITNLSLGNKNLDLDNLPYRRDEIGKVADAVRKFSKIFNNIIKPMMANPLELENILKKSENLSNFFGWQEKNMILVYTDMQSSTTLSEILKPDIFNYFIHAQNKLEQLIFSKHNIPMLKNTGDGSIFAKEIKNSKIYNNVLDAGIESFRIFSIKNYYLHKFGICGLYKRRIGIGCSDKILHGWYSTSPLCENKMNNPVESILNSNLNKINNNFIPNLNNQPYRIGEDVSGVQMNYTARIESAAKNKTGFGISELFYQNIKNDIKTTYPDIKISKKYIEKEKNEIFEMRHLFIDITKEKHEIDTYFSNNKQEIKQLKKEWEKIDKNLFLENIPELLRLKIEKNFKNIEKFEM